MMRVLPWKFQATLLVLLTLGACSRTRQMPVHNVLLITVDTLRADHLSCYGYARQTTPNIDRLAEAGLRFTYAQSPRAKTTPAVASLMTGLYPHAHGVRDFAAPLAPEIPTLAEALQRAGYATAAVLGNWVLADTQSGLGRGFDTWIEDFSVRRGVPPDDVPEQSADLLTDAGLKWLEQWQSEQAAQARGAQGQAFFLWLHYMDPHGRYEPPVSHRIFHSEAQEPIADEPGAEPPLRIATYNVPTEAWLADGRIDAACVVDRYDGEIHSVDAELGRLFEHLRLRGLLETTWIVITADHGESLGELNYWFEHGAYAHEATCRVPLVIHPPLGLERRPRPGVRSSDIALADLAPTTLEWLGLPPLPPARSEAGAMATARPDIRGQSRAQLLWAEAQEPHIVYCEKIEAAAPLGAVQTKAARLGRWKLVQRLARTNASTTDLQMLSEELFDVEADPGENQNCLESTSAAPLAALRSALSDFWRCEINLEQLPSHLKQQREDLEQRDPEAARRLRAMGYH